MLLAAREHDNGWREADAAPRFDPELGRPFDFRYLSIPDRIDIWRRGVRRFANAQPLTALLILRHAAEIHRTYRDHADWKEFGEELEALRHDLGDSSGIEPSAVERDYRFLELADTLSLGACGAFDPGDSAQSIHGYQVEVQLGRIGLEPFPLAGATTLEVAYRLLPSTTFDSAASFSEELATATWRRLPVRIEPI